MTANKKYNYSYPENIELGKKLSVEDRKLIADALKISNMYVWKILVEGTRTNKKVLDLANRIAIANSVKNDIVKNHK